MKNQKNTVAFEWVNTVNGQVQKRCHVAVGQPPLCSLFIFQMNESSSLIVINARIVFYLPSLPYKSCEFTLDYINYRAFFLYS